MLGFTHFFNNDDNFILNTLSHEFKGDGYSIYFALCESICAALDKEPEKEEFLIYFSTISKRSHISLKKTKKVLHFFSEILKKNEENLKKNEVFLKISEFEISQMPEIKGFIDYKLSKVNLSKVNKSKKKLSKHHRENDADGENVSSLPAALFFKSDLVEEYGEEFINDHFDDAVRYYDENNLKGELEDFVRRSLERSEEKFGCPHKAMLNVARFLGKSNEL